MNITEYYISVPLENNDNLLHRCGFVLWWAEIGSAILLVVTLSDLLGAVMYV